MARARLLVGALMLALLAASSAAATAEEIVTVGPTTAGPAMAGATGDAGLPPQAAPGQCFAKVIVPETLQTYTEQVEVAPSRTVTRIRPGPCGLEDRMVVTRPASVEEINVPATYRTVTETVVVKPAGVRTETYPAVYDTVTEQVMVRPGYTTWRASRAPVYGSGVAYDGGTPPYANGPTKVLPTGEVVCLVQVPPEYRLQTRQILRIPERTVQIAYPAETAVVSRQVVDTPAHVVRRDIPAETKMVKVRICAPDQPVVETIPREYRTVTRTRVTSPAHAEWRPTTCQAPAPVSRPPPPRRHHVGCGCRAHRRHPVPAAKIIGAPPCPSACAPTALVEPLPPPGPPAPETAWVAPPPEGDGAVVVLQGALAERGYYRGPRNGLMNAETAAAMTRFQHDHHLAEGRLTGETANALGVRR